jgi:hypothetical protein
VGDKEFIQNFVGKTSLKRATGKIEKEMGDNIKMEIREIICEFGRLMELDQDCVRWRTLILGPSGLETSGPATTELGTRRLY